MTDIENLTRACEVEIKTHAPHLADAEVATMTASAIQLEGVVMRGDRVVLGQPAAVRICGFLPREFIRAKAQEAAAAETNPAMKTHVFVRAMGADSWDDALGLDTGLMPPDVGQQVSAELAKMEETWARTAERLGFPGKRMDEIL